MSLTEDKESLIHEELRSAENDLSKVYDVISKLNERLHESDIYTRKQEHKIEKILKEKEAQDSKIRYLRGVIFDIKNSRSWRLTKPLRKFAELKKYFK